MEGEHPQEEGETLDAVAFFDFDNNPKYKSAPVSLNRLFDSLKHYFTLRPELQTAVTTLSTSWKRPPPGTLDTAQLIEGPVPTAE